MNINQIVAEKTRDVEKYARIEREARAEVEIILAVAKNEGRSNLTQAEDIRCETFLAQIKSAKENRENAAAALARAKVIQAEENASESRLDVTRSTASNGTVARSAAKYDEVMRVGSEPRVYSRADDPEGKGTAFLTDVIGAFRGNPQSNERLSRHAREYEVDNKGRQSRAAGDVTTGSLPNLVVPSYLVSAYAAKPSARGLPKSLVMFSQVRVL